MKKRLFICFLAFALLLSALPVFAAGFSDIPAGSWAAETIQEAASLGLMEGQSPDSFGYGATISKAEFVTVLCRMFGWDYVTPDQPSFTDVPAGKWYYKYVETALAHGVFQGGSSFAPDSPVLREEMAVYLVNALGYSSLAESSSNYPLPFTDITANKGYINIAYNIGMTDGRTPTSFAPYETARREEAAAMLLRVYKRYAGKTGWLHGFYAFSSFEQRYVTADMDAVSLGWSAMTVSGGSIVLNTGGAGGNQWKIPSGCDSILEYFRQGGTKTHLNVYMDTGAKLEDGASALITMLKDPEMRADAILQIMNEATRVYPETGFCPYSGVTIDFEGLKASSKEHFSLFMQELASELHANGMTLYVAVQPLTADGLCFDGFDYRLLGEVCDKVILMAHDYHPTSLEGFVGTTWHTHTAMTPIDKVYYSLCAVTDKETGVQDKSKLVLAVSFSSIGWYLDENGKVASPSPVTPAPSTIAKRLVQEGAVKGWSEKEKSSYVTYDTEDGKHVFLWYESPESINAKIQLARMLGINGISLWRIGTIPDHEGYNVWQTITQED